MESVACLRRIIFQILLAFLCLILHKTILRSLPFHIRTQFGEKIAIYEYKKVNCRLDESELIDNNFQADSNDELTDTKYYQWIPFMFAINALIFLIPNQIWKFYEGGFIKGFMVEESESKFVTKNFGNENIL